MDAIAFFVDYGIILHFQMGLFLNPGGGRNVLGQTLRRFWTISTVVGVIMIPRVLSNLKLSLIEILVRQELSIHLSFY